MSSIANMKIVLNSKYADPAYRERTRQQLIHLSYAGNEEAKELVGEIEGDDCPCAHCKYQRMLDGVRAETYK